MRAIWKFNLNVGSNLVDMPLGASVIHFGEQDAWPTMWAIVDTEAGKREREYIVEGTGLSLAEEETKETYIGTVQIGLSVWHLFDVTKLPNALLAHAAP